MDVQGFVREHYGFDAEVVPLCAEKDLNYLLRSSCGEFVLKITRTAEFQVRAMEHAASASLR